MCENRLSPQYWLALKEVGQHVCFMGACPPLPPPQVEDERVPAAI